MARRQLSAFRLAALTIALAASVSILVSSQLPWVNATSTITPTINFDYAGVTIDLSDSRGPDPSLIQVLIIAALVVAIVATISLVPYLRFLCTAVVLVGAAGVALALTVMSEINKPVTTGKFGSTVGNVIGDVSSHLYPRSPGMGLYILIIGGTLAVISGALTLLTPRTARPRYQYGMAPYSAAERPVPARWSQEDGAQAAMPVPGTSSESSGRKEAAPKNPVFYAILGLVIPGLPSLMIRNDKTIGIVQLSVWVLSSLLLLLLLPMALALPLLLAVPIWSAITGYRDALRWGQHHRFIAT